MQQENSPQRQNQQEDHDLIKKTIPNSINDFESAFKKFEHMKKGKGNKQSQIPLYSVIIDMLNSQRKTMDQDLKQYCVSKFVTKYEGEEMFLFEKEPIIKRFCIFTLENNKSFCVSCWQQICVYYFFTSSQKTRAICVYCFYKKRKIKEKVKIPVVFKKYDLFTLETLLMLSKTNNSMDNGEQILNIKTSQDNENQDDFDEIDEDQLLTEERENIYKNKFLLYLRDLFENQKLGFKITSFAENGCQTEEILFMNPDENDEEKKEKKKKKKEKKQKKQKKVKKEKKQKENQNERSVSPVFSGSQFARKPSVESRKLSISPQRSVISRSISPPQNQENSSNFNNNRGENKWNNYGNRWNNQNDDENNGQPRHRGFNSENRGRGRGRGDRGRGRGGRGRGNDFGENQGQNNFRERGRGRGRGRGRDDNQNEDRPMFTFTTNEQNNALTNPESTHIKTNEQQIEAPDDY